MKKPSDYRVPASVLKRMRGKERRLISKAWKTWRPPLRMTISEWADEYRRLPQGVTAEPGRYSSSRIPWCKFIMDAVGARKYRDCVLVGAAQVMAKTEMLNNIIGYYIHADPSPILVKYPTKDSGEAWSKFKFTPMVEATPVLRELFGDARSRDSGNTILDKKFPGGGLTVVGANSPSGLRQRSKRIIIQDEIDSDEGSAGDEGDPTLLADKRAESFRNAVKVKASTPTIKGASRCWKILENSTFHEWHAKCPHCGGHHVLSMANLHWPKTKDENGKDVHDLKATYYQCPDCSAHWTDIDRQRAIMAGSPIARHPGADVFGFHVGGLYKLMGGKEQFSSMLEEFAFNFIEAKRGGRETLKVWTNTFAAECFDEEFEKLDEKAVIARAEDYDPSALLPVGVLRIEGAADVQQDRIECELVGMGEGEESWGLGYAIFHGDTSQEGGPWDELDRFIARTFRHPCGKDLPCTSFFIDSGNQQDRVFKFTGPRKSRGVFASKGYNSPGKQTPILPRKPSINNKRKVPQWMVGVTAAKTVLYSRIMLPIPGAGSMHFPKGHGYDHRYFRQLTSEKRMLRYAHGKPYYIYEAGDRRNEPLDIRVYALAAHRRLAFDSVKLKMDLALAEGMQATPRPANDTSGTDTPTEPQVGPRAEGMTFERAPIEAPKPAASEPPRPASSVRLPAYVPMHLRKK
jgi:phage terminase large subunit GpA-like protein